MTWRQIAAGVGWVLLSMALWNVATNFAARILIRSWDTIPVNLKEPVGNTYNFLAVGGLILIPVLTAILALRGRLPWTARRGSTRRGFEISVPPEGPANP
jgi:hypothetical protein